MHRRTLTLLAAALLLVAAGCASGDDDPSTRAVAERLDVAQRAGEQRARRAETAETEKTVEITVAVSDGKVTAQAAPGRRAARQPGPAAGHQ